MLRRKAPFACGNKRASPQTPLPNALGKAPTHLPPFKAEQHGTGRGNKGRIRSCARRTGASLPGVNDSSHDTKRAVSSGDGPFLFY